MSIAEKLTTVADNQQKVYDAGKQAEYDAFWNGVQDNGDRTNYQNAFTRWNISNFKPKYNIITTSGANMFNRAVSDTPISLPDICENAGIIFDTSNATAFDYFCCYADIVDVGTLNLAKVTNGYWFYGAEKLESARLILSDEGKNIFTNCFNTCYALKNFVIESGVIADSLSFPNSKILSKESIVSVINALSSTTTELTATFTATAVNIAFETSEGAADGSASEEWLGYVSYKSNWNISLI